MFKFQYYDVKITAEKFTLNFSLFTQQVVNIFNGQQFINDFSY